MIDYKPLIAKLSKDTEQLQLYRLLGDGRRKIVVLSPMDWDAIITALNHVQEEARK